MTEEISEEQRQAIREKYAPPAGNGDGAVKALGWIAAVGFALTVVAMLVIGVSSSPGPVAILFWPAMLTVGPTVGFLALIAYLSVKAVILSRK